MYIDCNGTNYYEIRNLHFCPEVDVTGATCPINEYTVDIRTDTPLQMYTWAILKDDAGATWARYIITEQVQIDPEFVRITAQSQLCYKEHGKGNPSMYTDQLFTDLAYIYFGDLYYTVDSGLSSTTISGYHGEENERDSIHRLLFATGSYIRQFFSDTIDIKLFSSSMKLIPYEETFWRPTVTDADYYSRISLRVYQYTLLDRDPETTEEWVLVSSSYYLVGGGTSTYANPNPISGVPAQTFEAETTYVQNSSDYQVIFNRLSMCFYKTMIVDCINNGDYLPGERVCVYVDETTVMKGYIQKADFTFGHQARSRLYIVGCESVPMGGGITVRYYLTSNSAIVETEPVKYLPEGWLYTYHPRTVLDVFTDQTSRIVAIPTTTSFPGRVPAEAYIILVPCMVELRYNVNTLVLSVWGVDEITAETVTRHENSLSVISLTGGGSLNGADSSWEVRMDE